MWFLFGTRTDYEDKDNGKTAEKVCPSCKKLSTFREQVRVENFHIFFIPLFAVKILDNDTQVYECSECGKHFSIIDGQFGNPFSRFRRRERTGRQESTKASAPSDAEANPTYDVSTDFERLKERVSKRQV